MKSMKKVLLVALVMVVTGSMYGCGGNKQVKSEEMQGEFAGAPSWVLDPSDPKNLSAMGSAPMSKAGLQYTKNNAIAAARDELARIMGVKVNNLVKNFTQATGIGDDEVVDRVSSQVSKQVASQTIIGSQQKDIWISSSNTVYVYMVVDGAGVAQKVKDAVQSSYKNEAALWQQFQAKKAYDDLDAEIEKEFSDFTEK